MIAIRGAGSQIAKSLVSLLPSTENIHIVHRDQDMPLDVDRYLFCSGIIRPKQRHEQTKDEIEEGIRVNLWQVIDDCERIFYSNDCARICVIGSESGFSGSFDGTYALAKRELHRYVERKRLRSPDQQLVCIAPSIIEDCGMTLRRNDHTNLMRRKAGHPKHRFLESTEVAALVYHCLYIDRGYLSGTVIRMNGGVTTCAPSRT